MVAFDLIIPKGKWFLECRFSFSFFYTKTFMGIKIMYYTYRRYLKTIKNRFDIKIQYTGICSIIQPAPDFKEI